MSHSICNVVVGYPIPRRVEMFLQERKIKPENAGFKCFYHGSTDFPPSYAGIRISQFSECEELTASILVRRLLPTDVQLEQAVVAMQEAKESFEGFLDEYDDVPADEKTELLDSLPRVSDVHLIWSTS